VFSLTAQRAPTPSKTFALKPFPRAQVFQTLTGPSVTSTFRDKPSPKITSCTTAHCVKDTGRHLQHCPPISTKRLSLKRFPLLETGSLFSPFSVRTQRSNAFQRSTYLSFGAVVASPVRNCRLCPCCPQKRALRRAYCRLKNHKHQAPSLPLYLQQQERSSMTNRYANFYAARPAMTEKPFAPSTPSLPKTTRRIGSWERSRDRRNRW
jgi:hypothetical protein